MGNKKLLHMPTGLVGESAFESRMDLPSGAFISDKADNFKPLSEFDKSDLRDGDYVINALVPEGFMYDSRIHNPIWEGVKSVTRNNDEVWNHNQRTETQQILESLSLIIKPSAFEEANELFRRLEAIEAKRSAE